MALDLPLTGARGRAFAGFALLRILRFAALAVAVAAVAFALMKLSPVDPVEAYLGPATLRISPEQRARIAAHWGFDLPPLLQFAAWARNVLAGDWGTSVVYNEPVLSVIAARAGASFALMAAAWLLSGLLGFALGLLAGSREGSLLDRAIRLYAYVLAATPPFWLAMILLLVFAVGLGWAPFCCAGPPGVLAQDVTFVERLAHLALPALALTLFGAAPTILHSRAKMIEIARSDIVLFARAQGARPLDILLRHGARNAALPALTIQFAAIGELFGGSVLAEQVFSYPGLGRATIEAALRGDVPLLLAATIVASLVVGAGNLAADLISRAIDPRLRAGPVT